MKYTPNQYAHALHDFAKDTPPAKRREMIREFLGTVSKNSSRSALPDIIREFEVLSDKEAKLHHVTIRSRERLPESGVSKKLHFKATVKAERDVRLQGGAVVEVDDLRIDNSIAGRLQRARAVLAK